MSIDPKPLKYMGTQSKETMDMAAAMALAADRAAKLDDAGDAASRDTSAVRRKIRGAARWVLGKAKNTLRSAAGHARDRAKTAVATRTQEDPLRAVLVAAATGALLMGLLVVMARSGVRRVRRTVSR